MKKKNCYERKLFTGTKSKWLNYDEAVSGAIVEYAFLPQNGTVKNRDNCESGKKCIKIICIYSFQEEEVSKGIVNFRSSEWIRKPLGGERAKQWVIFPGTSLPVAHRDWCARENGGLHLAFRRQRLHPAPTPAPFFITRENVSMTSNKMQCVQLAN